MKIDKSNGNWCDGGESDNLDDISYQLYLNYYMIKYGNISKCCQLEFMTIRTINKKHDLHRFYVQANKLLRKEKLQKLKK